jgi:hypothetical protein
MTSLKEFILNLPTEKSLDIGKKGFENILAKIADTYIKELGEEMFKWRAMNGNPVTDLAIARTIEKALGFLRGEIK